jgi:hypothetical protein
MTAVMLALVAVPSGPLSVAGIVTTERPVAGAAVLHQVGTPGRGRLTADTATGGPNPAYDCDFNVNTDAFTGADGTASEIGWEGNHEGVVTCLGGTFLVQDGQDGMDRDYGFGIYHGEPTTWADADGYLPAQITTFRRTGAVVSITEFADRVVLGGDAYAVVYSRIAVTNPTDRVLVENPDASPAMVALHLAPDAVGPHAAVVHDYAVTADRFGHQYPWPSTRALAGAGGFDQHFTHMQRFWNHQLAAIAEVHVPDTALDDAYRSGFVYTQIARSGNDLDTGVNGYESEFSHDVVGILTTLFTQGYFAGAHGLLLEARNVMGSQGQYDDGIWTYSLPWAIYLMKTGDIGFVKENFATVGPLGASQPSIEDTAHEIAAGRTGTSGIMGATDDIDTEGSWTTDDFQALLGLAAYHYLAVRVGDASQAAWATLEYDGLLAATNDALFTTIVQFHLNYLPCSILQPNTANRCSDPEDANWTSPLGDWAWEGGLLGATVNGPGLSMIDATYSYGFGRLLGTLPPNTTGGFPDDYYSTSYNAAQGTAGLAGRDDRDQGIMNYEFMIANSQSGPYSWWESSTAPSPTTPWIGRHPAAGQGSSPHAWGMAGANSVLLDALVAQATDGDLIVGRGMPAGWVDGGPPVTVTNFPTLGGRRSSLAIFSSSMRRSVSLAFSGRLPSGHVLFQLPSFVDDIASTSAGTVDQATGTVTLAPGTRSVTVRLRRPPADG